VHWFVTIPLGVVFVGIFFWMKPWETQQISSSDGEATPQPQSSRVSKSSQSRTARSDSWRQGEDLKRYPRRLAELERQLEEQHEAAELQHEHLGNKLEQISAKEGREELVARYEGDLGLLERRTEVTQRVLGTVWKTRAILHLRVHLAIAARQRPDLAHLPPPLDVDSGDLEQAARSYTRACIEVRTFVETLDSLMGGVDQVVPPEPEIAEVQESDRASIAQEVSAVEGTLASLRERMDSLADTLDYLGDRFRTQRVVESGSLSLSLGPEGEALLDEVTSALSQLDELSAVGDKGLADAAVDGLTEDIANLEQVGLDGLAEAEAHLEVQQLLAQFSSRS
jgi:predicted  nucleic acid-binding Zn-ribbon protein